MTGPGLATGRPVTTRPAVPCKICRMFPELDLNQNQVQIQRIVSSKTFKTSEVHRNLLTYLAEKSLSGEAQNLKEYTVGLDVFGKPPTYDPRQESVVRMHVGRLRQKLTRVLPDRGPGGSGHRRSAEGRFHADVCAATRGGVEPEVAPPAVPVRTISHARDHAGGVAGRWPSWPRGISASGCSRSRRRPARRRPPRAGMDAGSAGTVGAAAVVGSAADGDARRSGPRERAGRRRRATRPA